MKLRILLLEDSVADARMIKRELARHGYGMELNRVQSEADLRRELAARPPDLVLSNDHLAGLSGFQALDVVRALCPRVPFIFVSGSNDQQLVCDMFEAGADGYVFKHDLQDLAATVDGVSGVPPGPPETPDGLETTPDSFIPGLAVPEYGCLSVCPHCHQARDETGHVVPLEDYCYHRLESLVICQLCAVCAGRAANAASAAAPPAQAGG